MKTNLVIVESPSKAKTIEKYLGASYKVVSTKGHIMDLPKSRLGVDLENDFKADYIKMRAKSKEIKALKESAKKIKKIYLASDNDREGEAISFHVLEVLKKHVSKNAEFKRIIFNEITKNVIRESIKNPKEINYNMVDSQKARRVLDRLVGYKISPILWKKVKKGLSAGRVQTVTLRLIVDREKERLAFKSEKYWKLKAKFGKNKSSIVEGELDNYKNKKVNIKDKKLIDEIVDKFEKYDEANISKVSKRKTKIKKKPPYITATLQQEAFKRFGFSSKKTMAVAQTLYEGVDIGNTRIGLITYMRTDSIRISDQAQQGAKKYIEENLNPNDYSPLKSGNKSKSKVQDAHEAIRPTDVNHTPKKLEQYLTKDQYKIYSMIWERFLSNFLKEPEVMNMTVNFQVDDIIFKSQFKNLVNKGYFKVYSVLKLPQKFVSLPDIKEGEIYKIMSHECEEKETEPPKRYDEASLIKKLKDSGIGRPSTYAPTISILYYRNYIVKEKKKIIPTKIGMIVCDLLIKNFPEFFNTSFTANMENKLDKIENGESDYKKTIENFWKEFKPELDKFSEIESVKDKVKEKTGIKCKECDGYMLLQYGKYGPFLGCENFPECKSIKPISYGFCDKCSTGFLVKRSSNRKSFLGCSNYPKCKNIKNATAPLKCPNCGSYMINNKESNNIVCINSECGKVIER